MPHWSLMLIWAGMVILVAAAIHGYLWFRLVRSTRLQPLWRRLATAALVLMGSSIPLAMLLGRSGLSWTKPLTWLAFLWMGFMFFLLLWVLCAEVVRLGRFAADRKRNAPANPERRLVMTRMLAGGAVLSSAACGSAGLVGGLRVPGWRRVQVALPKLPAAFDGQRIVQWTDVHAGLTIGRSFIEAIVEKTNAARPDLIAITGDLVDGSVNDLRDTIAPLGELRARHGVYFAMGNHEYYSGANEWARELERLGIRVLRNECVRVGELGAAIDLAGLDDPAGATFGTGLGPDMATACEEHDPTRALIVLAHQPRLVHDAASAGAGLVLSGHTHGGQIWPFGGVVMLAQPYLAGLHQHTPETQIYVSRGVGYWGPPMRFLAPAELTEVLLSRA